MEEGTEICSITTVMKHLTPELGIYREISRDLEV
jgi:hypothetical protein